MNKASPGRGAKVAVVIVNYRTPDLALRSVEAVAMEREILPNLELLVVDGGSGDGSAKILERSLSRKRFGDWITFLPLELNGGFGWANNEAIIHALQKDDPPDFFHLLNPDAQIEPGAIVALADCLCAHREAAAAGSQLLDSLGAPSGSGFNAPSVRGEFSRGARTGWFDRIARVPAVAIASNTTHAVDWTTGASVMFRAEALKQSGLFDEGFFLYHEEIELMWRLRRAGWKILVEPQSRVRHVGGASTGLKGRTAPGPIEQRMPRYWYRSRARYFGLTRGPHVSALAYLAWLVGYPIWALRRALRIGRAVKPFGHELRDHLRFAFPRASDRIPAVRQWNDVSGSGPAWMERGW